MKTFSDDVPQYVLASFKDRFLAMFLDVCILFLVSFPLSMLIALVEVFITLSRNGVMSTPLTLVFLALRIISGIGVSVFYYGYFYKKRGTSLGKYILNMRVICLPYAQNPSYKTALLRDVFGKILSALTLLMGYFIVLFRKDRRALHDLLSDTLVLKRVR